MNLDDNQKGLLAFVAMLILALILLLIVHHSAHAHDITRPDLDSWFNQLKSGKGYCCSNGDGTALSDVDWDATGGHYRVRIDGEWIAVPDEAVITEPNRAGRTMVWPYRADGKVAFIRCFMPGALI